VNLLSILGIAPPEKKDIIGQGALGDFYGSASRQDGENFKTNMVTLSSFQDSSSGSVLGLSATWACVNLLAGTIGSLPLMVYRIVDGQRVLAKDHPLYYVLHDSPNFDQTALDFWEWTAASLELYGNSYAKIDKRFNGEVFSLTPLPKTTSARRLANGDIEYRWIVDGKPDTATQLDILHIRGFGGNPLGGVSTLTACAQTFGAATKTEVSASALFENGARPSGVLSTDKTMNAEQRKSAEGLLAEKYIGAMNSGRPMLLDGGVKWEQLSISPADSELLESRKFSGEEICRLFGIPPAMVGYGDKSSNWGTGKEVDVLGFQKFTLRRRLKRIEQALEKQLLGPKDKAGGVTIEFNLEGLLRGDSEARGAFYATGLNNGWMTINEVRRLENLKPVDGGDVPRMQIQNVPLAVADAQQESFNARV
jgi:HK97 family phage portal protein